ncbi:unnamed protein product, partial [Brenthis ino]
MKNGSSEFAGSMHSFADGSFGRSIDRRSRITIEKRKRNVVAAGCGRRAAAAAARGAHYVKAKSGGQRFSCATPPG